MKGLQVGIMGRWIAFCLIAMSGFEFSVFAGIELAISSTPTGQAPDPYLYPNETNPLRALEILQSIHPEGYLLSVGSERAFATAGIAGFDGIIFTDASPTILFFNQVNSGLIAISDSVEHYRRLRLTANEEEWKRTISQFRVQTQDPDFKPLLELLGTKETYDWWVSHIRQPSSPELQNRWNARMRPLHAGESTVFRDVNYLYNSVAFDRLQRIMRQKNFRFVQINYNDSTQVARLAHSIRINGEHLALIDMSNLWWPIFLTESGGLSQFLSDLAQLPASPSTILMLTHDALRKVGDISQISPSQFQYFGYPFARIQKPEERSIVTKDLIRAYQIASRTSETPSMINGQVFRERASCSERLLELKQR